MPSGAPGAATFESLRMSSYNSLYTGMTREAVGFCWSGKHCSTRTSASSEMNICQPHHSSMARRA